MSSIFLYILITSLWTLGLTVASQEGMILYPIRKYADAKKNKIWDAIIKCLYCMPSIHSVLVMLYFFFVSQCSTWNTFWYLPFVITGSCFLNLILWSLYLLIDSVQKYFSNLNEID